MTTLKITSLALLLGLSLGLFVSAPASAQGCTSPLIGAWRMTSLEVDTLVLTPADPSEGWRVTYERI